MDQPRYLLIHEGNSRDFHGEEEVLFDPSATVKIGFGGYSTVYKEVIRGGHSRYDTRSKSSVGPSQVSLQAPCSHQERSADSFQRPKTARSVARKWFPYTPDFDRELLFLKTLTSPPNEGHNRIMKYLAVVMNPHTGPRTPSIGKHSLLFPLADLDLGKYLITEDFSRLAVVDLMKQLAGLADALSFLHSGVKTVGGTPLVGSHMDLNPSNILIFLGEGKDSTVGIWRITDFSTATLTDTEGQNYLSPPKLVPDIYSAPEIQDDIQGNAADPASDIWSLGCVIFEVLVGFVQGKDFKSWKDKHGNSRCYYERSGEGCRVESRVWKWLTAENPSRPVGSCRQLVMDMISIDAKERPTAMQVRDRLEALSQ